MNAPSNISRRGKLFKSNRSQAVRIPKDLAFPDTIKDIMIRRSGNTIMITPVENFWDDFFGQGPDPDFPERFPQGEYENREKF
jgi:antitoxin VapB